MEALDGLLTSMFSIERWPFWSAVAVFTVFGQFAGTKLFTRERAYMQRTHVLEHHFWFWGRETLMVHPILGGLLLGSFWLDPEGHGWPAAASQMYFASAGALSLFAWVLLKAFAKRQNIELTLPGVSSHPPPPER